VATGLRKLGAIVGDGVSIGCNAVLAPGTVSAATRSSTTAPRSAACCRRAASSSSAPPRGGRTARRPRGPPTDDPHPRPQPDRRSRVGDVGAAAGDRGGLRGAVGDGGLEGLWRAASATASRRRPSGPTPGGQAPTLVTHAFLHGGWAHLIGNLVFLWVFGDNVEDRLGHLRFLAFYALGAASRRSRTRSSRPTRGCPDRRVRRHQRGARGVPALLPDQAGPGRRRAAHPAVAGAPALLRLRPVLPVDAAGLVVPRLLGAAAGVGGRGAGRRGRGRRRVVGPRRRVRLRAARGAGVRPPRGRCRSPTARGVGPPPGCEPRRRGATAQRPARSGRSRRRAAGRSR
jgi:hypothetical protein